MARVLLCARGGAAELPAIASALHDRNAEAVLFDCSAFPSGAPLTLAYDQRGFAGRWSHEHDVPEVTAVWQSLVVGTELPAMEPGARETCVAASERAVIGWLDSLHVFQLDPHWNKARADNKPYQLRLAQRVGFAIPATLVSNDADAVRAFARRSGGLITKMLVQPTGSAGDDAADVVFTTAMTAEDLDQLDGLDLCPMIFQEQIENRLDVRVTIVGRRIFSAALDAHARGGGDPDWRRQSYQLDRAPAWAAYELPREVADRLLALLDHLGLNYGVADLIVRPDGRHVFLELNASGSFAFLGAHHAGPIAAAIADVLTYPGARRVAGPG